MTIYDLTHPLHNNTPVYPGKSQPNIWPAAVIELDGYRELRIEMDGHTGTHIDAPAHMLPYGKTLDQFPASHFCGTAVVVNIPERTRLIETSLFKPFENKIADTDYVLLKTGWSSFWEKEDYLLNYPVLTEEAANWLVGQSLKGIGLDTISVDPMDSEKWPIHQLFFKADLVIIENLNFQEGFNHKTGRFYCFPLYFSKADGSPVRAVFEIP